MTDQTKSAVWEGAKEVARLALFAAAAAVIGWATQQLTGLDPNSVYYVVGTAVLRFADKFLHENKQVSANGLAPF